jgi:hypothetical protein
MRGYYPSATLNSEVNNSPIFLMALASVPTMLTVLISLLINNSRLGDLNGRIGDLRHHMDVRFDEMRVT